MYYYKTDPSEKYISQGVIPLEQPICSTVSTSPVYALTGTTTIRSHRPARRLVQTYVRLKNIWVL